MSHKKFYNHKRIIILFVVTFFSKITYSQCIIPNEFEGNTGLNMTCLLLTSFIDSLPDEGDNSYLVVLNSSGIVVGSASMNEDELENGQASIAVWGDDTFTNEIDGAQEGEELILKYVDGYTVYTLSPVMLMGPNSLIYTTQAALVLTGFEIESSCL